MHKTLYILCGGKGKRLGAITKKVPKPLIRIHGKPFLAYLIDTYSRHFDKIVLLAGYMGQEFLKHEKGKVSVIIEEKPLGTGGALVALMDTLPHSFYVCNGDTFIFPFDLRDFFAKCEFSKRSMLLLSVDESRAKGAVRMEGDLVKEFKEKGEKGIGNIYAGFSYIRREDLVGYGSGRELSMEKEIFPKLAGQGKLGAYIHSSTVYDIGTANGIRKFKETIR